MTVVAGALAKETSTTTGTGSYALLGAATNFRAFSAVVTPSATALVPYGARMGAEFERGIGLLSASGTLQRIKVVESSNSNNAVNWAAGTKEITCTAAASGAALGKNNIAATAPVDATHNYTLGYAEGSLWIVQEGSDLNDVYLCTYAGVPGSATARWVLAGTHTLTRLVAEYAVSVGYNDNTAATGMDGAVCFGVGAKALWPLGLFHGSNYIGAHGEFQTARHLLSGAVPAGVATKLTEGWNSDNFLAIPANSAMTMVWDIAARDNVSGDCAFYTLVVCVKRTAGDPAIQAQTLTVHHEDDATWTIVAGVDTGNDGIYLEATGDGTNPTRWTAALRAPVVTF
jgi:hypothetical protein